MDNRTPFKTQNLKLKTQNFLLLALLSLGLFFRVVNLDQKIFWVDEVATVIRAAGYTKAEIISQLADGEPRTPADLLAYQRLTPNRTLTDTFHALSHSPEHTPLYFLLTRFWMQGFGSSISAIRSFSVVCSLLVLPCVYWFCQTLFNSNQISRIAVTLIAVSPFFVAYAQEARPYSFWLLTVVVCCGALLRAMRLNSTKSWTIYALTLILTGYTSLLSLLVAFGQGVYVLALQHWRLTRTTRRYLMALSVALLTFLPWLWVVVQHPNALAANTTWMRTPLNPFVTLAIWLYSFAVLFFDVPVVASGWIAVVEVITAAIVLAILGYALYKLAQTPRRIWLLLAAICLPIPLTLLLLDLIFHGQVSATPRYLIPSQLGVLIAVAYSLASPKAAAKVSIHGSEKESLPTKRLQQGITAILLSLSLLSCVVNLDRSPDYQKARNRFNPEIAAILNQATHPVLLAEPAQTIDLLSLSHSLNETVQIRILPPKRLIAAFDCEKAFLFNPSASLVTTIRQTTTLSLQELYQPDLLTPADIHLSLWATTSNRQARKQRACSA